MKHQMVSFAAGLLVFVGLFASSPAYAGENEWTYVGLYPEMVTDIIVHPNNPNILYVSAYDVFYDTTCEGGIFKTTDHGLTWDTLGFRHYRVNDLALDPQHPETLWAACDMAGAWRSTNGGASWENRSNGLPLGGADWLGAVYIAVSPFEPDLLMCAGTSAYAPLGWLCRTTDGGEQWRWVVFDWPRRPFNKVEFDSLSLGRVFADDPAEEIIWVSEDSGSVFHAISAPDYIDDFALDPFRRDWLWCIGPYSFLYSPDAGSTWVEPDTSFPPNPYWGQLVRVSPVRISTIYATDYLRVYQSDDDGLTWLELAEGWQIGNIKAMSVGVGFPIELWAGIHGLLSYTVVDTSNAAQLTGSQTLVVGSELYPNPASGVFYLDFSLVPLSSTFSLYNVLGQRVLSVPLPKSNGVHAIHLPGTLPSGIYFGVFSQAQSLETISMKANRIAVVK